MPVSKDYKLPKDREPVFPGHCICCHSQDPDSVISASDSHSNWLVRIHGLILPFMDFIPKNRVRVEAPACAACSRDFKRKKVWRTVALYIYLIIAVGIAYCLVGDSESFLRKYYGVGLAIVFSIPMILWFVFHPSVLSISTSDKTVEYEFSDAEYADEFAKLNGLDVQ